MDPSNEITPMKKYKKFVYLPYDVANAKRRKVNEQERVRQKGIAEAVEELKALNLPHCKFGGYKRDSRLGTISNATLHIRSLRQQIKLRDEQETLKEQVILTLLQLMSEQDMQSRLAKSKEIMHNYNVLLAHLVTSAKWDSIKCSSSSPVGQNRQSVLPVFQNVAENQTQVIHNPEVNKQINKSHRIPANKKRNPLSVKVPQSVNPGVKTNVSNSVLPTMLPSVYPVNLSLPVIQNQLSYINPVISSKTPVVDYSKAISFWNPYSSPLMPPTYGHLASAHHLYLRAKEYITNASEENKIPITKPLDLSPPAAIKEKSLH